MGGVRLLVLLSVLPSSNGPTGSVAKRNAWGWKCGFAEMISGMMSACFNTYVTKSYGFSDKAGQTASSMTNKLGDLNMSPCVVWESGCKS